MHLQFPSLWRKIPYTDTEFHAFMLRYNQMRRIRGSVHCLECNEILPRNEEQWEWIKTSTDYHDDYYYGTHCHTCYSCLKNYCYGCDVDDDPEEDILKGCGVCQRDYCEDCSVMFHCSGCTKNICNDCYKYECVECDKEFCSKCVEENESVRKCGYCDGCYCRGCYVAYDDDGFTEDYEIDFCTYSRCDVKQCCKDCVLQKYRQGQLECAGCIKRIAPLLVGESLEHKQLQEKYDDLKVEMKELKRQIEELKLGNGELR